MTILYKLTDQDNFTRRGERNECRWGPGISHEGTGRGGLCSEGWIHAYEHPLLAALLNPIHAAIAEPKLWRAEGKISLRDGELKVGAKKITTFEEIPLPELSTEFRVTFAIKCTLSVCKEPGFTKWAEAWLERRRSLGGGGGCGGGVCGGCGGGGGVCGACGICGGCGVCGGVCGVCGGVCGGCGGGCGGVCGASLADRARSRRAFQNRIHPVVSKLERTLLHAA